MAPKVLLTQILPPDSQKLIESAKDIELVYWDKTGPIPREKFLELAKGKLRYHLLQILLKITFLYFRRRRWNFMYVDR